MKRASLLRTGILTIAFAILAVAPRGAPAATIFTNFGAGDSFNGTTGWVVSGSSSGAGAQSIATAFTPSANYTLTQIDLALQHISGTNGATVELVNSVSGLPGTTVLESWTPTGLPPAGSSSLGLADMLMSSGPAVALASGTQYWVVALPADATTEDTWAQNSTGDAGFAVSHNGGTTWTPDGGVTPAFDVLGTVAVPAPPIGRGLPIVLAVGGVLFGAKLLERAKRRRLQFV